MDIRPRRLRENNLIRRISRETRLSPDSLVLPFFVREGSGIIEDISSMVGQKRYSPDTIARGVEEALEAGVRSFMIFGITENKDEFGSSGFHSHGVVQEAIRTLKKQFSQDIQLISDVCLCEYTSHGHCGIIKDQKIDNDSSLEYIAKTALSHAIAGCDMVAPSDMMDGRVTSIRNLLDQNGFENIPIMSYAAKYSSSFYGPFREAVGSAPQFGDRQTYQMDYHNKKEAIKEVLLDVSEGADIVMVKPALSYLDVICEVSKNVNIPVAAYSVSGEYALIKAAASQNLVDEYKMMCETAVSIYRAGANILVSYYAKELAQAMRRGDIG